MSGSPSVSPQELAAAFRRLNGRRSKYGAKTKVQDGIKFDSRREAARYRELLLMQAANEISGLEPHPKFALHVNGIQVGTYSADASYWCHGKYCVEDCKGYARTQLYRLKRRMMQAEYGITVQEV